MWTAIVPFGSIEHQGPHLPLGADALLGDWVGRQVAERLEALLVPTARAVSRVGPVACLSQGDVGPQPESHSGEWLASVMLALAPGLVSLDAAPAVLARELERASAERGAAHLERFVAALVGDVRRAAVRP